MLNLQYVNKSKQKMRKALLYPQKYFIKQKN